VLVARLDGVIGAGGERCPHSLLGDLAENVGRDEGSLVSDGFGHLVR
jgi:hypothetical protein